MGMYDYVRCEVALPDGYVPQSGFLQTKDLDCKLTTYTITSDGRLVSDRWHYESVPKSETVQSMFGIMKVVKDESDVDHRFHGVLNFYDSEGDHGTGDWKWHEYNAKFTDGRLVSIDIVPGRYEVTE